MRRNAFEERYRKKEKAIENDMKKIIFSNILLAFSVLITAILLIARGGAM